MAEDTYSKNENKLMTLDTNAKEDWCVFFPNTTPEQLYQTTTKDMPESTKLAITTYISTPILTISNKEKDKKFEFKYTIKDNYIDYIGGDVCEEAQKHGISKTMQRNIFEFCKENNLNRIDVSAIDIGAYAWTRMGFAPDITHWPTVRGNISQRFNAITKKMPAEQKIKLTPYFNKISKALKSNDPKSIWIIADEKEPFYFDEKISWGKALLLPQGSLPPCLNIYTNITYSGSLNLKDKDCTDRMETYAYGSKVPTKAKPLCNG